MNTEAKKTEKLVSALYLLTSFFDDREPMKWRLRELGGALISQAEPAKVVSEIIGHLTVAKNTGLISDTNFDIVHREFSRMLPAGLNMAETFKSLEAPEPVAPAPTAEKPESKPQFYLSSSVASAPVIKDKISRTVARERSSQGGVVAAKKNSRQTAILNLLKKKKEIMVKDVVPLIDGVSEKTIQRELLALVSSGILKKEGEKRWSRYSLAE